MATAAADRYQDLAIFPEGVDVPLDCWPPGGGFDWLEVRGLARTLLRLSLIESYDAGVATVRLHDVLRVYLGFRAQPPERQRMHAGFLDAHRPSHAALGGPDRRCRLPRGAGVHFISMKQGSPYELVSTVRDVAYLAKKAHLTSTSGRAR